MQSQGNLLNSVPPSLQKYFPHLNNSINKITQQRMLKTLTMTFLLWLINRKATTGYLLIKKLEVEHPSAIAHASRIYPLLVYMEKEGLLRSKLLKTGKRESKEYSTTAKGKLLLKTTNKLLSKTTWGTFLRDISKK